jgi:hypothetical protein
MNTQLIEAVLLAWVPIVVILFRAIGPARAVLVGLLGGLLFLPVGQVKLAPTTLAFPVDKYNVTGLALIVGVLIFDRRSLMRARPHWLDLPMAAFYLTPLIGLITGVPGAAADVLDVMIGRGLGWVVPYVMGRIYFGRSDGPREVVIALMISGVSYIPICLYEQIAGPSRYLAGLIYGLSYQSGVVNRLGGWRPEGFLGGGLAVSSWMAMSTVMATWLWLGGAWRPRRGPAWLPALALLVTTLSCRGVYGYLLLGTGVGAALLTRWLRSRTILVLLAFVPLTYMVVRASGLWDGALLVKAAELTGRGSTVAFRIEAENELIRIVLGGHPILGFGTYVWHAQGFRWPDGSWLHALWMGGLLGLASQLLALYVGPAALALSSPRGRPVWWQALSPRWGLAAWCILQMIDNMHNTSYFTPTALIAGTLVGLALARQTPGVEPPQASGKPARPRGKLPTSLLVTLVVLIVVEILGRLPRTPSLEPASPPPPSQPASK